MSASHNHDDDWPCDLACGVWIDGQLSHTNPDGTYGHWPKRSPDQHRPGHGEHGHYCGSTCNQSPIWTGLPLTEQVPYKDAPAWHVEAVPDPLGDQITLCYMGGRPVAVYAPDAIELIGMLARAIHETAVRHKDHGHKATCPLASERDAIKQATADVFILRETLKII